MLELEPQEAPAKLRYMNTMFHSRRAMFEASADMRLLEFFSYTRATLDIAIYDIRSRAVLEALASLSKRARVRIIVDAAAEPQLVDAALDPKPGTALAALEEVGLGKCIHPYASKLGRAMHHKFAIRDNAYVWAGGMNFTDGALNLQDASALVLDSAALAELFTQEFERILADQPHSTNPPGEVTVGKGNHVVALFGPQIKPALLAAMTDNPKRVRLISYALSDGDLLDALQRYGRSGRDLRGLYDPAGMEIASKLHPACPERFWFRQDPRFVAVPSNHFHLYGEHNGCLNKIWHINRTVFIGSYNFSDITDPIENHVLAITSPQIDLATNRYFDVLSNRYRLNV